MENLKIFAFSDEVSPDIDLQIKALLKNGLSGMEIRNVDGVSVSDITLEKAAEVKEKLDKNGLCVWSIGSPIGKIDINDNFSKHLKKFCHTLEVAKILGTKNMRIFSFYIPAGEDTEKYKEDIIEKLTILCEIAKDYGVNLCHENEKGIYGDTAERCRTLFENVPDLKGIFDPANFVQCGVDTAAAFDMLKEYIYYVHIKDAILSGENVPAGAGAGNIQKIAAEYIALGGKYFTIEPHLTVFEGLKELERVGEKSKITSSFASAEEAFDFAVDSFRKLL